MDDLLSVNPPAHRLDRAPVIDKPLFMPDRGELSHKWDRLPKLGASRRAARRLVEGEWETRLLLRLGLGGELGEPFLGELDRHPQL